MIISYPSQVNILPYPFCNGLAMSSFHPPASPFNVRAGRLPNGDRLPLLCTNGLPRYDTTDWMLSSLWPEGNATNTMAAKLRAIGHWLRWCEAHGFAWEDRVRAGEFLSQNEIASAVKWMRLPVGPGNSGNVAKLKVADNILAARMGFVAQYLRWIAEPVIHGIHGNDHDRIEREFQGFLARWRRRTPDIVETHSRGQRFGLSDEQQALFLRIIHPDSIENPFEPGMRVRNHALLLILMDHGLRMAEPLMIRMQDLKLGDHEFRIPARRNDPNDPRRVIPSPKKGKNHQIAGGRHLKFTPASQRAVERWANEDRRDEIRFPGARKSPYLFISERGLPLSVRRVHSIFEVIREAFPALGERFTPHILRHTFVEDYIRNHPQFTTKQRQDLLFLMDWSQRSKMPERYGWPAIKESAGKATAELSERRRARALALIESDES